MGGSGALSKHVHFAIVTRYLGILAMRVRDQWGESLCCINSRPSLEELDLQICTGQQLSLLVGLCLYFPIYTKWSQCFTFQHPHNVLQLLFTERSEEIRLHHFLELTIWRQKDVCFAIVPSASICGVFLQGFAVNTDFTPAAKPKAYCSPWKVFK